MPTVSSNDLRNGMSLNLSEGLFAVVEFQHVKPGKGGAFVRTKLKNVRTGAVIERTYRSDEKLDQALIDKRDMQFLYLDGDGWVFMDNGGLRAADRHPGQRWATSANYLKEGDSAPSSRCTRGRSSASTCPRHRSSSPSPRPSRGCRETGCRAPANRRRSRTGLVTPGPALRQPRRPDQGRHQHRVSTSPGRPERPRGRTGRLAAGDRPGSGRWHCSTRLTPKGRHARRSVIAELPVAPDRVRGRPRRRGVELERGIEIDADPRRRTPSDGASNACR